jgi:hypothetical protein
VAAVFAVHSLGSVLFRHSGVSNSSVFATARPIRDVTNCCAGREGGSEGEDASGDPTSGDQFLSVDGDGRFGRLVVCVLSNVCGVLSVLFVSPHTHFRERLGVPCEKTKRHVRV